MIKRIKDMILDFFLIMAGILLCTAVFCTIFNDDIQYGIELLWQIVALAFFSTLPGLVFWSKKELSKKQILIRQVIHLCLLLTTLIFFAYDWEWLSPQSIIQPIIFIVMIALVYTMVNYFTYIRDKKTAKELNERLEKFKHKSID
jgi:predicted neutral ceramidase superfamily lipid hydrolase